jgi:hypothetical protein
LPIQDPAGADARINKRLKNIKKKKKKKSKKYKKKKKSKFKKLIKKKKKKKELKNTNQKKTPTITHPHTIHKIRGRMGVDRRDEARRSSCFGARISCVAQAPTRLYSAAYSLSIRVARYESVVTCFIIVARIFNLHFGAADSVADTFGALPLELAHDDFLGHGLEVGGAGSGGAGPTRRSPLLRTLVQIHGVRVVEYGQHAVRVLVLDASRQQLPTAPHSFLIRGATIAFAREEVLDALPHSFVIGSALVARVLTDHLDIGRCQSKIQQALTRAIRGLS